MKYKNITEKEKATIQLYNELGKLYRARHNRPSIKLDKPYQSGWQRYFKVRDDIARGPHGKLAADILKVVQHYDYSSREDFHKKSKKTKKLDLIKAGVRKISVREFENKGYPESWKKHFDTYTNKYGQLEYHFNKQWWYTEVIEKYMVTHYYEATAEIDQRLEEVKQIIEHNQLEPVYMGLKKGRNLDEWDLCLDKKRTLSKIAKKEMRDEV